MLTRLHRLKRWLCLTTLVVAGSGFSTATAGIANALPAQDFLVHNWDVDEGLPSTCINAIVRTRDGYVWLATRHGLARFDGFRFVTFNMVNTPALKDNRIISLATDRQDNLWIGAENGTVTKLAHGIFSPLAVNDLSHGRSITSLAVDAEDHLWLATEGSGLLRFDGNQLELFTNGLPSPDLRQLLADPQGQLWFLTAAGKLGWIEKDKCHVPATASALPANIRSLALARAGGLWLAAQNEANAGTRIFYFHDQFVQEETQNYPWPQNSWRARPGAVLADPAGNLWCGTLGAGVFFRPAGGSWQQLVANLPFSQAETLCLVADESASIWIGSRTSGLHQAVPRPMSTFFLPPANHQNVLLTVCVRRDGSIWGGTDGAGVFRWTETATNRYGELLALAGLQVNALLEDSHQDFWAGTSAGLYRFQNGQFVAVETAAGDAPVTVLFEYARKKLWAGTTRGLICLSDSAQNIISPNQHLPAGIILALTQDITGNFWVAIQGQGIFQQKNGSFTHWSPQHGASAARQRWGNGGNVRSLLADADGSLWVATRGDGLFRLTDDDLREWNWENDGLPSNHHFTIVENDPATVWLGSENGLFGYAKKTLLDYSAGNPPPVPWRLTEADGLPYKVCSGSGQPVAARTPDGRLWFPDGAALVVFAPGHLPRHPPTWPPVIEEIRVDGQPLAPQANQPLRVMSGARSFEFFFTSPNILTPARLRFRYRLRGLDKDWTPADTQRSAQYSRLPPGDYTFAVRAGDNSGVENENQAELRLIVTPRFWENRWFQVSAIIVLLGGAGFAARQTERVRSRRKLATLERERALERERSRIARDIHDDLGASLTEVALLGDMAGANSESPDELREQTQKISAAAREMTQSLEAIVWAVRPENDSLHSLVEYMNRRTDELFEKMPRQYQFIIPSELPACSVHAEVRHNVFLAYKEALTNSLKYAGASLVRIELSNDDTGCRILITDNGRGFDATATRAGGTGLRNMRQRMQEIGGRFELQTQPGEGTTVRLYFPLPQPNFRG